MHVLSITPGRIRFKNLIVFHNRALAKSVNAYVDNLAGVKHCKVNSYNGTILVLYDQNKTNYNTIQDYIKKAVSSLLTKKPSELSKYENYVDLLEKRDRAKTTLIVFGLIFLCLKFKEIIFGRSWVSKNLHVLQTAALIAVVAGYPILKKQYKKFTKNTITDADVILTVVASILTITRESTEGILVLVLKSLTDYLELTAQVDSQKLLNQSMKTNAGLAWKLLPEGTKELVPVHSLSRGETIVIHEAELVPADGEIVWGEAYINNVFHTGQTVVTKVIKKEKVFEGMSVISGSLRIRITRIPEFSKQRGDLPIKSLEMQQKISSYATRITLFSFGAAALNLLVTGNIRNAISVLLLLCPAGSDTAVSSGVQQYMGLLNKNKIYLRNPGTFEKILDIDNVLFDKTGTLTYGRMDISEIAIYDEMYSRAELLEICAACETHHVHPIAQAIEKIATNTNKPIIAHKSQLIPARGVQADCDGKEVHIGNAEFLQESGIDIAAAIDEYTEFERKMYTPILVSVNNKLSAMLILQDSIRSDSYTMIDKLRSIGLNKFSIITGDVESKATYVGQQLNIEAVHSRCNAQDKVKIVDMFKKNSRVMMVGDGINDISAMKRADVSVSLAHNACDNVKINSDCVITEDNIERLADLITLSKKSYKLINQSINFSKKYNIIFGTLAFCNLFDPFRAKTLDSVNSLLVLLLNKRIRYLR